MLGLCCVTQGRLAGEFVAAMDHVVGTQERVEAVCIGPDDDIQARRADLSAAAARVDRGKGVILLTDMFGGTPSNIAISLMGKPNVEVIAGITLPTLTSDRKRVV